MIQNNLQGILGNCKEIYLFHSSGYYNMHPTEICNIGF